MTETSKIYFHRFILYEGKLQGELCLNMKLLHSATPAEYSVNTFTVKS